MKTGAIAVISLLLALVMPTRAGILDFFRKSPEDTLKAQLQAGFNANKQMIFNSIHPVGTAVRVEVHDVALVWKNGIASSDLKNLAGFVVRYTIYWQGPITTDGFTKVAAVFDCESQRYVSMNILATNGVTNADAWNAAGEFVGGYIDGYLRAKGAQGGGY